MRLLDIHFQFVCAAVFYFTRHHFSNDITNGRAILWLSMSHLLVRTLFLYQHIVDPKHSLIEMITLIFDCFIKLTIICFFGMQINIIDFHDESRFFFLKLIIGGRVLRKVSSMISVVSTGYISSSLCVTIQVREDVRAMMKTAQRIRSFTITTKFLSIMILSGKFKNIKRDF